MSSSGADKEREKDVDQAFNLAKAKVDDRQLKDLPKAILVSTETSLQLLFFAHDIR